ncbi:MAG: SDR family NAD(P)-dependent oxidoreductase [Candidatus Acidiferrales bacterium]
MGLAGKVSYAQSYWQNSVHFWREPRYWIGNRFARRLGRRQYCCHRKDRNSTRQAAWHCLHAAAEIEAAGGRALPVILDIRFEDQAYGAVAQAVQRFGGIDTLINNASA